MTGALLERPASMFERRTPGGRVTLEELLDATLAEARTNGSADCPVCHARITRAREGGQADGAAQCGDCGTRLS